MASSFAYATILMAGSQNREMSLRVIFLSTRRNWVTNLRSLVIFSRIRLKRNPNFLEQLSDNNLESGADGTVLTIRMHSFLMRCSHLVLHKIVVSNLNWRRKYWPNGVMTAENVERFRPIPMMTLQRSRIRSNYTSKRHHHLIRRRYGLTTSITCRHKIGWKLGNVVKGTKMNENSFVKNARSARKKLLIGYAVGWLVLLLIIIFSV